MTNADRKEQWLNRSHALMKEMEQVLLKATDELQTVSEKYADLPLPIIIKVTREVGDAFGNSLKTFADEDFDENCLPKNRSQFNQN